MEKGCMFEVFCHSVVIHSPNHPVFNMEHPLSSLSGISESVPFWFISSTMWRKLSILIFGSDWEETACCLQQRMGKGNLWVLLIIETSMNSLFKSTLHFQFQKYRYLSFLLKFRWVSPLPFSLSVLTLPLSTPTPIWMRYEVEQKANACVY